MKTNEIKKSEEKATVYFGTMFLLSLALDIVNDGFVPIDDWIGGVLVIMIVILLILGIKQVSVNQELKKEMQSCKDS